MATTAQRPCSTFDGSTFREQGKERVQRAAAWMDQEIARLFGGSGWTQERIAKRVGKSRVWVTYRLQFGSFLHFVTTVTNHKLPANLTERRFRGYWEQTKAPKEAQRFKQVVEAMEADMTLVRVGA